MKKEEGKTGVGSVLKKSVWKLVFLVIVIIVIWLTLKDSWEEIWSELNHTSWKIIAGVFSLSILYNCFDGIAVAKLVRNYAPGFAWQDGILCSFYYSFFRVVTFGSGTAAAGMYYVNKKGIPVSASLGIFTLNYTVQRVAICLYFIFGFLSNYGEMNHQYGGYQKEMILGSVLAVVTVAVLIIFCTYRPLHKKILALARRAAQKETQREKIDEWEEKAVLVRTEAYRVLKNRKLLLNVIMLNFLKLSMWYFIPAVVFQMLNSPKLSMLMSVAAMMTALSGVIPAPGGVGAVEFVFVLLFTPLVGRTKAASGMLIYRFSTYILPFLFGAVVVLKTQVLSKRKEEK